MMSKQFKNDCPGLIKGKTGLCVAWMGNMALKCDPVTIIAEHTPRHGGDGR